MSSLPRKSATAPVLSVVAVVALMSGCGSTGSSGAAAGSSAAPSASGSPSAAAASPSAAVSAGTAGKGILTSSNWNGTVVDDAASTKAISGYSRPVFDKAIQFADMFVSLDQGNCSWLSGTDNGTAAMYSLFTPNTVDEAISKKYGIFLDVRKSGLTFPKENCAGPSVTKWKVESAGSGTAKSPLRVSGSTTTVLYPTGKPKFSVTQTTTLWLVRSTSQNAHLGWLANQSYSTKPVTDWVK
ncbi:hypothetical protein [Actinoplanes sp. NPDC048796]|uniref:hypothetical protein n=1 Tax=Actinoplanes sp. NPDC048796 TaxID=3155640 RepID=UPI0033F6AB39